MNDEQRRTIEDFRCGFRQGFIWFAKRAAAVAIPLMTIVMFSHALLIIAADGRDILAVPPLLLAALLAKHLLTAIFLFVAMAFYFSGMAFVALMIIPNRHSSLTNP